MDVAPTGDHVSDQLVRLHVAAGADDRTDVPVAELAAAAGADRDARGVGVHVAADHRVHRLPVAGRDVDAEVERRQDALGAQVVARVAESPPDRMPPVERLQRPAVHGRQP